MDFITENVGQIAGQDYCVIQIPYLTTTRRTKRPKKGRALSPTTPYSVNTREGSALTTDKPGAWIEAQDQEAQYEEEDQEDQEEDQEHSSYDLGETSRTEG